MERQRNLRVSLAAEALSVLSLILAIVTLISPYWGRFSNEGSPNTGGKKKLTINTGNGKKGKNPLACRVKAYRREKS